VKSRLWGTLFHAPSSLPTLDTIGSDIQIQGNMNMIENAGIIGVTRVILVTSVGAGDSKEALPEPAYEAMKDFLVQKTKVRQALNHKHPALICARGDEGLLCTEDENATDPKHWTPSTDLCESRVFWLVLEDICVLDPQTLQPAHGFCARVDDGTSTRRQRYSTSKL
jgi:hypothetical protein